VTDHPVLAAITAERERLAEQMEQLVAQVEEIKAQDQALAESERLFSEALDGEATAPGSPPQVPTPPPPSDLPSPGRRRSPAAGSDRAVAKAARQDEVLEALRLLGEPASSGQVAGSTDLTQNQASYALKDLAERGKCIRTGHGRHTLYRLPDETRAPATPAADRNRPNGADLNGRTGTLEGRVLAWLQVNPNSSGPAIGIAVETPLNDLRPVLGKLMREGDVRTGHKNGETVYHFVG
jgi:hypothetical protein